MTTTHETEPLFMSLAKALEIVEGYLRGRREPAFAEIVRQARDAVAAMPELVAALDEIARVAAECSATAKVREAAK